MLSAVEFRDVWIEILAAASAGLMALVGLTWKRLAIGLGRGLRKFLRDVLGDLFNPENEVFDPDEALVHQRVQEIIHDLCVTFGAKRALLFQFHNGDVYLLGAHTWKASCTFEVAVRGVSYVSSSHTGLLASNITDMVSPVITGNTDGLHGVDIIRRCPENGTQCLIPGRRHRVVRHVVGDMNMCKFRFLCEENGVGTVYSVNLVHGDYNATIGYISLHFDALGPVEREQVESRLCKLCAAAEQAQFLLQDKSGRIKVPARFVRKPNEE